MNFRWKASYPPKNQHLIKEIEQKAVFERYADCMADDVDKFSEAEKAVLRELIKYAYQEEGSGVVYDIANEKGLPYAECKFCEAETPTILDVCAICGTTK